MTKRYKFTNKCYTCDAQDSVGVNKAGDFSLCTAKESSATSTYIKKDKSAGATGPGLPGDARAAAQAASDAANEAMKQAQLAAQKADEAAQAAVDKFRKVNAGTAGAGSNEQLAEAHRLAEQIRATEASKAAEASTAARNIAEQKYNVELKALRKQQLLTDRAEEILMRAEKAGEEARAAYTQAAGKAAQAAKEAASTGALAAGQAAQQAEADEMASAARAAQRRAIVAAKSAKDAADKANIAANIAKIPPQPTPTLPPCEDVSLLQGGQPRGCALPQNQIQAPVRPAPGAPPQAPSLDSTMSQPANQHPMGLNGEGLDTAPRDPDSDVDAANDGDAGTANDPLRMPDGTEDTALNPDGSVDPDRISSAMADQLAEKLEDNPKQISNPRLYDMTANPLIKTQMDAAMAQQSPDYLGSEAVPENMPVSNGGVDPAQLNLDPNQIPSVGDVMTQNGFVPGMMSTLQLGSSMHSWGRGTSRKL